MRVDIVVSDRGDDHHLLPECFSKLVHHHRVQLEDFFGRTWAISVNVVSVVSCNLRGKSRGSPRIVPCPHDKIDFICPFLLKPVESRVD